MFGFLEIDHKADKHTRHNVWHSNSCLVGISHLGQGKMSYHKRKYLITQEIKHVWTKGLTIPIKYIKSTMRFFSQSKAKRSGMWGRKYVCRNICSCIVKKKYMCRNPPECTTRLQNNFSSQHDVLLYLQLCSAKVLSRYHFPGN